VVYSAHLSSAVPGATSYDRLTHTLNTEPWKIIIGEKRITVVESNQDAAIFQDNVTRNYFVACRGSTEIGRDWLANDLGGFLFKYSGRLQTTMKMVKQAQQMAGSSHVITTGHSLGGLVAKFCGILSESRFYTVNAPPINVLPNESPNTIEGIYTFQDFIRAQKKMFAGQGVEARVEYDVVSKLRNFTGILAHMREPEGTVRRYTLKLPPSGSIFSAHSHSVFMDAFMIGIASGSNE